MRKSRTTVEISKASAEAGGAIALPLESFPLSPEMPKSVVKQVNYHWKTLRKTSVVTSQKSLDHDPPPKFESDKVLNRIKAMKNSSIDRKNSLISTEKIKQFRREKSCDSMSSSQDEIKKVQYSRRNSRISILDQVDQFETKKSIKKITASKMLENVPKLFRDKSSESVASSASEATAKLARASSWAASRRSSRVSIMDQVESYHNVPKIKRLSGEKIVEKIKRSTESLSSTASSSTRRQSKYNSRRCSIMDQVEAYHKPRDGIKKMVFSHLTRRASLVTNWFKDQDNQSGDRESMLSRSESNGFLSCKDSLEDDESGIGLNNSFDSLPFIDDDSDYSNGACALSTSPSTSVPSTSAFKIPILTPTLSCTPKSLKVLLRSSVCISL